MGKRKRSSKAKTDVLTTDVTAVITIGNELMGDDGIGPAVFKALEGKGMSSGFVLIDGGTGGLGVLHLMSGYGRVIIVDCCDFGGKAGEVKVFRPDEAINMRNEHKFSLHGMDMLGLIELGKRLGKMPNDLSIIGVQPKKVGMGDMLSPAVKKAVPKAVKAVLALLEASS